MALIGPGVRFLSIGLTRHFFVEPDMGIAKFFGWPHNGGKID